MEKSLNIVVAGHSPLFGDCMQVALNQHEGFNVKGVVHSATEMDQILKAVKPEVLISDMAISGVDSSTLLKYVQRDYPKMRVLAIVSDGNQHQINSALDINVGGIFEAGGSIEGLVNAIKKLAGGESYYTATVHRVLESRENNMQPIGLSRREIEIMKYLAKGHSAKDIGELLDISSRTVETHKANIMRKLNVKKATHLVKIAFDRGYVKSGY